MSLSLASLNVRGLRDPSKCACLLSEFSNVRVNVAAMQETHFICAVDTRVLRITVVIPAFSGHCSC